MEEKIYTLQEVADYLKVTRQTIYNYVKTGKLKANKLGTQQYRVAEKDLQNFLTGKKK